MKFRSNATAILCLLGTLGSTPTLADSVAPGNVSGKVVVSGIVPDEATRSAVLGRLRDLYGPAAVVDHIEVGGVVPPPNWTDHVTKLITPSLKQVRQGQLSINGTQISVKGTVANEAQRQQIVSDMATSLNPTYSVDNGLAVGSTSSAQSLLDNTLSNRVVEFESSSTKLTPVGIAILDEMAAAITKLGSPKVQITGHTDSSGDRMANIKLSLGRANAVRDYLIRKGIPAETLTAVGGGPDHPVTANDTAEGRAKNRRIEFRLTN